MGNSASSLPFSIESKALFNTASGWSVHEATRKSDGQRVSVFKASKGSMAKTALDPNNRDPAMTQLVPAQWHFRKCKTLKHPNILRVEATLDTDDANSAGGGLASSSSSSSNSSSSTGELVIVTEEVRSLRGYLDSMESILLSDPRPETARQHADQVSWGLRNIIEGLSFLHQTAKLAHGNIGPDSIFVTPAGDFKLADWGIVTSAQMDDHHFRSYEAAYTLDPFRSPERLERRYDVLSTSGIHAMDAYAMGALMDYVYSHPGSGTNGRLPDKLIKAVDRLKSHSIRARPRLLPLLKCPVFDNAHVKTRQELSEIGVKPAEERIMFLRTLTDGITSGVVTEGMCRHIVFHVLMDSVLRASRDGGIGQDVVRREVLAAVPALFQIAETYFVPTSTNATADEFKKRMTPAVESLFQINDRGVRGALLSRVQLLSKHLDKNTLNISVFEPMCSGFSDSSAPLRELTLKNTVVLVSVLTPANLEKLMRYLVRLQSDAEPSIRTNTAIFIGKIAPNLSQGSRSKLIVPAFTRAMRDEFTPCRLAALRAVSACRSCFEPMAVANSVLPEVVKHSLDASLDVRTEAFHVVETLLEDLKEKSREMASNAAAAAALADNGPSSAPTSSSSSSIMNSIASSSGTTTAPASGSGYLSGLSSWVTSSTKATEPQQQQQQPPPPPMNGGGNMNNSNIRAPASASAPNRPFTTPSKVTPTFTSLSLNDTTTSNNNDEDGWDDVDDGVLDDDDDNDKLQTPSWIAPQSSSNINNNDLFGNNDDDFLKAFDTRSPLKSGGKLNLGGLSHKTTSSSSTKLITPSSSKSSSSMAQRKAEFAARKAEREKEKARAVKISVGKKKEKDEDADGWDDF